MSLTQKLDDHSENGYKVYIPNDCTSINGVRTRRSYTGYAVLPPLGVNLFVASTVGNVPFEKIVKSMIPILVAMLIALFVVIYFPPLSNWLPSLMDN